MKLLTELYKIPAKTGNEEQIKSFILEKVKDIPMQVVTDQIGNLFFIKGTAESYPCVAAHLDEVHLPCERDIVVDGDVIYAVDKANERVGCGADDKNGLWMIIQLLRTEPVLKVALFVLEEKVSDDILGCRGARACDLSFFDDVRYILEIDRKGASDVVQIGKDDTLLCPADFIPESILSQYGYQMVKGGKTDVVELKMRGLGIPVCNIGCGYYNAHTSEEYTVFSELTHALRFVQEILKKV